MQPANRPQRVEIAMRFIEVLFAWQGEPTGKDTPVGGGQKFEVGGQNVPAGTYLRFVKVFLQEPPCTKMYVQVGTITNNSCGLWRLRDAEMSALACSDGENGVLEVYRCEKS